MEAEKITNAFLITKEFQSSTEFSMFIEREAKKRKTTYLDMIVDYCQKKDIEMESITSIITPSLKEKIKFQSNELNLLKKKIKNKLHF